MIADVAQYEKQFFSLGKNKKTRTHALNVSFVSFENTNLKNKRHVNYQKQA